MSTIHVVVGGQYGSEGKGAIAAHLCRTRPEISAAVRVAGPNAGHSAYDQQGRKWALRQVPVAAVVRNDLHLVLGQGSEIDVEVLTDEVQRLEAAGIPIQSRLTIDASATILEPEHREAEGNYGGHMTARLGSTGKGVGAARAERIWRRARTVSDVNPLGYYDSAGFLRDLLFGTDVLIEGTQGYALGLHTQHYPQCTSSDCTATDFLAMAGLAAWDADEVTAWVCLRTYPIRVAGNSGYMHEETTWQALGEQTSGYIQPEHTTVTRKERRVGHWDLELARQAVRANGARNVQIALTFFDYWHPEIAGRTAWNDLPDRLKAEVISISVEIGAPVALLGTGPNTVIEVPVTQGETP